MSYIRRVEGRCISHYSRFQVEGFLESRVNNPYRTRIDLPESFERIQATPNDSFINHWKDRR